MISKVDRKAAMRASLSAEKRDVNARFAAADAVLSERPGGLGGVPPPKSSSMRHRLVGLSALKILVQRSSELWQLLLIECTKTH